MEISRDTKRKIADGPEGFLGDLAFFTGMFIGSGSPKTGINFRRAAYRKIEYFYDKRGILYTPRIPQR